MKPLIMGKTGDLTGVRMGGRTVVYARFVHIFPQSYWGGRVVVDALSVGRIS